MIWKQLKYFNKEEAWEDASKMNGLLLLLLDKIRANFSDNKYFIVHAGFATCGHSTNSQHYLGNAVDFHIKNIDFYEAYIKLKDLLTKFQVEDKVGFGIYPDWLNPGFHLDVRGYRARWGFVKENQVAIDAALDYYESLE